MEGVGREACGADELAEPSGGLGRLTERSRELGRAVGVVEQVAYVEQPEIRVGALRQPAEEQGQDLLHQPRRTGEAAGQLAHRCAGALPVGKAEGAEPGLDRSRASQQLLVLGGKRLQQGTEVQTLVDGPHRALMARQFTVELFDNVGLGGVAEPECAPDLRARVVGDGHRVDLSTFAQLEAVLDSAQEPVGVGEVTGVVLVDVSGRAQLGERGESRWRPQVGIEAAVDELEQLDGELDVANAAAAPLHLSVGEAAAGQLRLASGLEVAQCPEIVSGEDPGPELALCCLVESSA